MTLFETAFAAHGAGKLAEAEQGYRAVLAAEPAHADAWHLLGMLQHQRGLSAAAVESIARALKVSGPQAAYLTNLGVVLHSLGRNAEAVTALEQALTLQPNTGAALFALASALHAAGRLPEAEARYRQTVALQPSAAGHNNLGNVLKDAERNDEAAGEYRRALALDPGHLRARINLGIVLQDEGALREAVARARDAATASRDGQAQTHLAMATYELGMLLKRANRAGEAIALLREAATLCPGDVAIRNNLANALVAADGAEEAEAHLRHALTEAPDLAETHFNLGNALKAQGKLEAAATSYEAALRLRSPFTKARINLSGVLGRLGRTDEAVAATAAAVQDDSPSADAWNAHGVALQAAGRDDEAYHAFCRACALKPDLAEAQRNMGLAHLLRGEFAPGWEAYAFRWRCPELKEGWREFGANDWRGEPQGTVLVWGEQGVGDKVLYAGMIPDLLARGQHVVMETDPRLIALFERSFPGVKAVAKQTPPDPTTRRSDIRWQTPLADLGRWLRRDAKSFPDRKSYLVAEPLRVERYRARLREGSPRLIVGISWSSTNPSIGRNKTLDLPQWGPILSVPGVCFVDLQYGDTAAARARAQTELGVSVVHFDDVDLRDDLDGAAALASACDLVISVSNTTVHLAAALGRPTWILVPAAAGSLWYWMRGDTPSPWYPMATIFRQKNAGVWQPVLADVGRRLKDFVPN